MVKAKDFWEFLCNGLDYRLFVGTPIAEFRPLYSAMDKDIMHYIPTANEQIALNIASGAALTGFKSAIIVPQDRLYSLDFSFIRTNFIPTLVITFGTRDADIGMSRKFKTLKDIEMLVKKIEKEKSMGVLLVPEEAIK